MFKYQVTVAYSYIKLKFLFADLKGAFDFMEMVIEHCGEYIEVFANKFKEEPENAETV